MKHIQLFEAHFSDGYYMNNNNTANQIMTVKASDNPDNLYNHDELMKKNLKYLIDWIRLHQKCNIKNVITFGNKTNATSKKISKEHFDILVAEFPEKSNI
jgi:hypothetical protein